MIVSFFWEAAAAALDFAERYGYVNVKPLPHHAKALSFWLEEDCRMRDSVPPSAMHCTLAFDRSNPIIPTGAGPEAKKIHDARIVRPGLMGRKPDKLSLVLIMSSSSLQARHRRLGRIFRFSFSKYIPHVTIKKRAEPEDLVAANENFRKLSERLPGMRIKLSREAWSLAKDGFD